MGSMSHPAGVALPSNANVYITMINTLYWLHTITRVGSLWMTVGLTGLSMGCPAGVGDANVYIVALVKTNTIFLCKKIFSK